MHRLRRCFRYRPVAGDFDLAVQHRPDNGARCNDVVRYATINPAIRYIVPLFVLEALLLVWWGVIGGKLSFPLKREASGRFGTALFLLGVLLYPALAGIFGRPARQAEAFGIAPDPTVIATVGLLLLPNSRFRWGLLPVPLLWCGITAATLWAMSAQS